MPVLARIDGWNPDTGAAATLRAGSHDDVGVCHADPDGAGAVWWPAIAKLPTLRYDLFDGAFAGAITAPTSSLTLTVEPFSALARLALADARIRLWTGPGGGPWTLIFDGRLAGQPAIKGGTAEVSFGVDDRWLDAPLLGLYAGTTGIEGVAALKGQAKPLALGRPRFVPGKLIDPINSVFQLSAYGPIRAVETAMERLVRFGASMGDHASLDALVAASIPPGRWATCLAGGLVRFGAPTEGMVSFHVEGDMPGTWPRLPGAIIARIAALAGGAAAIDAASLAALDTARPYPLSPYVDEQTTARQLIQEIAASVNAVALVTWTGKLVVLRVAIGAPLLTLASDGSATPPVASVDAVETGAPWRRLAMTAERTWAVHGLGDIATEAALIDRGEYAAGTTYREGDIVSLRDGSRWRYVATVPAAGVEPATGATWERLQGPVTAIGPDAIIGGTLDAATGTVTGGLPAEDVASSANPALLSKDEKASTFRATDDRIVTAHNVQIDRTAPLAEHGPIAGPRTAAITAFNEYIAFRNALTPAWNDLTAPTGGPTFVRATYNARVLALETATGALKDAMDSHGVSYDSLQDAPLAVAHLDYTQLDQVNQAIERLIGIAADGYVNASLDPEIFAEYNRLIDEAYHLTVYANRFASAPDWAAISTRITALTAAMGRLTSYAPTLVPVNHATTGVLVFDVDPQVWNARWTDVYVALYALYHQVGAPTRATVKELVADGRITPQDKREIIRQIDEYQRKEAAFTSQAPQYNISTAALSTAINALETWANTNGVADLNAINVVDPVAYDTIVASIEETFLELSNDLQAARDGRAYDAPLAVVPFAPVTSLGNKFSNGSTSATGYFRSDVPMTAVTTQVTVTAGDALFGLTVSPSATAQSAFAVGYRYTAATKTLERIAGVAVRQTWTDVDLPLYLRLKADNSGNVVGQVSFEGTTTVLVPDPNWRTTPGTAYYVKGLLGPAGVIERVGVSPVDSVHFDAVVGSSRPERQASAGDNLLLDGDLLDVDPATARWRPFGPGVSYSSVAGAESGNALLLTGTAGGATRWFVANDGERRAIKNVSKLYVRVRRIVTAALDGSALALLTLFDKDGGVVGEPGVNVGGPAGATGWVDGTFDIPPTAASYTFKLLGLNLTAGGVAVTSARLTSTIDWAQQIVGPGKPADNATHGGNIASTVNTVGATGPDAEGFYTLDGSDQFYLVGAAGEKLPAGGEPFLRVTTEVKDDSGVGGVLVTVLCDTASSGTVSRAVNARTGGTIALPLGTTAYNVAVQASFTAGSIKIKRPVVEPTGDAGAAVVNNDGINGAQSWWFASSPAPSTNGAGEDPDSGSLRLRAGDVVGFFSASTPGMVASSFAPTFGARWIYVEMGRAAASGNAGSLSLTLRARDAAGAVTDLGTFDASPTDATSGAARIQQWLALPAGAKEYRAELVVPAGAIDNQGRDYFRSPTPVITLRALRETDNAALIAAQQPAYSPSEAAQDRPPSFYFDYEHPADPSILAWVVTEKRGLAALGFAGLTGLADVSTHITRDAAGVATSVQQGLTIGGTNYNRSWRALLGDGWMGAGGAADPAFPGRSHGWIKQLSTAPGDRPRIGLDLARPTGDVPTLAQIETSLGKAAAADAVPGSGPFLFATDLAEAAPAEAAKIASVATGATSDLALVKVLDPGNVVAISGNAISVGDRLAFDSYVISDRAFTGGAVVRFQPIGPDATHVMCGLTTDPTGAAGGATDATRYAAIEYQLYWGFDTWRVFEGSASVLLLGGAITDMAEVTYTGEEVVYTLNGVEKRRIDAPAGLTLRAAVAAYQGGAKNISFAPHADITAQNFPFISDVAPIVVQVYADTGEALPGQLPVSRPVDFFVGGTNRIGEVALTVTASSGIGAAVGNDPKAVVLQSVAAGGTIYAQFAWRGMTITRGIQVTRQLVERPPPPTLNSGYTTAISAPTGPTHVPLIAPIEVTTNAAGHVTADFRVTFTAVGFGALPINEEAPLTHLLAKWQYSGNGTAWSDLCPEIQSYAGARIFSTPKGTLSETGELTIVILSGNGGVTLSANTTYFFRVVGRSNSNTVDAGGRSPKEIATIAGSAAVVRP